MSPSVPEQFRTLKSRNFGPVIFCEAKITGVRPVSLQAPMPDSQSPCCADSSHTRRFVELQLPAEEHSNYLVERDLDQLFCNRLECIRCSTAGHVGSQLWLAGSPLGCR